MEKLVATLILLPIIFFAAFCGIIFMVFELRMEKLEEIHHRAIIMATKEGYLTPEIQDDIRTKMDSIGFPEVEKDGITYPIFDGSTETKVLRDDPDPTVTVVLKYPAYNIQQIFLLMRQENNEDPGFYFLQDYGRSESYE